MDTLEDPLRILLQYIGFDFIDVAHAVAGIDEFPVVLGFQGELEDPSGHMGAEFFEQAVAGRQCLVGTFLFGDVQINCQVADP